MKMRRLHTACLAIVMSLLMLMTAACKQNPDSESSVSGDSSTDVVSNSSASSDGKATSVSGGESQTGTTVFGSESGITESGETSAVTVVTSPDWVGTSFVKQDLGDIQLSSYPVDTAYDWAHSIIKDGDVYKMWWVRQSNYDTIWYAESTDLKNWTNERMIMSVENDTTWIKLHLGNPDVVLINGTYYMYLEAPATVDAATKVECDNNVFLATSTNGVDFTLYPSNDNPQPIIQMPEDKMRQGNYGVGQPSITYKDGEFLLYYTDCGLGSDGVYRATSTDGIHFTDRSVNPKVYDRETSGVKYNAAIGKFVMASSLNPYDFDKSETRNSNIYIMESTDGIHFDYTTKTEGYKSSYIVSDSEVKVRNYPDFVTNASGVIDTYTMYVVYTEGTMADLGEDWRTTADTWDGHIVAVNPKEFANRTMDLPNGNAATADNLAAYQDNIVYWGKLSTTALYGTPSIDGEMDSVWESTPELSISRLVSNYASMPTSTNGTVRLMWDENFLYLYAYVKDSNISYSYPISMKEEIWHRDSLDVFIDVPNDHSKTEEIYTPKQYMAEFCADGDYVIKDSRENDFSDEFDKKVRTTIVSDGYIIEAKISWYDMVKSQIAEGKTIGLDFQINDDNGKGDRNSLITWNDYTGNAFRWLDVMGDVTLVK